MSDRLRAWVGQELERRGWSYGELARRANISRPLVSRTLSGDMSASADFCIKIAQALEEAPETVLRLADILPQSLTEDASTLEEINDILHNLTPEKRKEALRYIRYLYQTKQEDD